MSELIRTFPLNEVGRDFIVGDIHGCFTALRAPLASVNFDGEKDRLFSVGDLVDRGAESHEAVDWLMKPWFFAIRANHEQMAIDHVAGMSVEHMYRQNGGAWFLALPERAQADIARVFAELPFLIEIDVGENGLVGIVHADPVFHSWDVLKERIGEERVQEAAIWGRTRITGGKDTEVQGISAVVCGHTIIDAPRSLGNVIYIDTGAIAGNALTMLESTPEGLKPHQIKTGRKDSHDQPC